MCKGASYSNPAPKLPPRAETWIIFLLHLPPHDQYAESICWKATKYPDCRPCLLPSPAFIPLLQSSLEPFSKVHQHALVSCPPIPSPASFMSVWVKLSEQEFQGLKHRLMVETNQFSKSLQMQLKKQLGVLVYTDTENYCYFRGVV